MKQYRTYNFYDQKGQRLTIIGDKLTDTEINLTIIPCNLKDQFSKKKGIELYNNIKANSEVKTKFYNEIIKGDGAVDFMRYCRSNFYKLMKSTIRGKIYKTLKPTYQNKIFYDNTVIYSLCKY